MLSQRRTARYRDAWKKAGVASFKQKGHGSSGGAGCRRAGCFATMADSATRLNHVARSENLEKGCR